jgi:hypothetical protein
MQVEHRFHRVKPLHNVPKWVFAQQRVAADPLARHKIGLFCVLEAVPVPMPMALAMAPAGG